VLARLRDAGFVLDGRWLLPFGLRGERTGEEERDDDHTRELAPSFTSSHPAPGFRQ
jgi:hypothetical protein